MLLLMGLDLLPGQPPLPLPIHCYSSSKKAEWASFIPTTWNFRRLLVSLLFSSFFFFKVLFCSLDWNIVLCHCILPNFLRRFYVLGIISSLSQSRRSSPTWEMSGGTQKCNLIWPQSRELHGCSLRGLWVLSCYSGAAAATGHWWTGLAPGLVAVCWWVGPSRGWLWGFAEVHGTPTDRLEGEFQDGTNHCQYGSHWCFSPSWFLPLCQRL